MSQSTTSDLVSTIATQLNIVIVALRLLVDTIQNPGATSPVEMTPGSCPSRPPASPASPPCRTTTIPSISWAPCEQTAPSLTRQKTPSPTMTMTSSAGKRTPLTHLPSPTAGPPPFLLSPLSHLLFPPPDFLLLMGPLTSSPPPLAPFLLHPLFLLLTSLIHHPPRWLLLLPLPLHHPAPSFPLLDLANVAPLLPLPLSLPPLATTQTLLGMMIGAPKMMISFLASNAMNDFDPAGATSPPKCSGQSPRSALVGLNFSNYNERLHHDLHLRLLSHPFSYGRK